MDNYALENYDSYQKYESLVIEYWNKKWKGFKNKCLYSLQLDISYCVA